MTIQDLHTAFINAEKVIFIDVREPSEYMRLNIGGNRMNLEEMKVKIEAVKSCYTEGGYRIALGCVYHDSKRIPPMLAYLRMHGIVAEALQSSRTTGGGIVAYANKYGKTARLPHVQL
jgi:rhodanese-related sulfurtransferase